MDRNADSAVVDGFGAEWTAFNQSEAALASEDRQAMFDSYFSIFPWGALPPNSTGADIGCGSGRWAALAAPKAGTLHLVEPSAAALQTAKANLAGHSNVQFHQAGVGNLPFADASLDFAYCLGVLHHVPDTEQALRDIRSKLRPGAPFLLYLYYRFDNRPAWYRWLWGASNLGRIALSRAPRPVQFAATWLIAATVYWPIARAGRALDALGLMPASWPLSYYRDRAFYVMRTDAFDRFCTRLEKRFTRAEITKMLSSAGFEEPHFSERTPFWVSVSRRSRSMVI